ncbi:hypothetical protein RCH21_001007 [Arthrobacter sp. PL16]|nr:hypothetical protein [Arthrobacter sp. PL16]
MSSNGLGGTGLFQPVLPRPTHLRGIVKVPDGRDVSGAYRVRGWAMLKIVFGSGSKDPMSAYLQDAERLLD